MSPYNYLPPDEDKLKTGVYKVSFEIKVESQDELSISDITQDLTEGFERGFGEGFINRVASLNIEKMVKKAELVALKVGDKIKLTSDIQIKANIYNDDGYIYIGSKQEISETVAEDAELKIHAGSTGFVNKINKDGSLEVADLDKPYVNETWTELGIDAVNIDLITVKAEQVEKIDSDEVK